MPPQPGRHDAEPTAAERRRIEALTRLLVRRIETEGPLPFSEFMRTALYEPGLGYYCSAHDPWGGRGDYLTAPQVHPALGQAVARLAAEVDAAAGAAGEFTLVEVGSGDGALLCAALAAVRRHHGGLWRRLRVISVEAGERARALQRGRLPVPGGGLAWGAALEELPRERFRGLIVSNELLDAFPVERVRGGPDGPTMARVHCGAEGLRQRFDAPPSAEVRAYLRRNGIRLRPGQIAEVCPAVEPWLRQACARLRLGGILTIDYGRDTGALYDAGRSAGTLVCQRRFRLGADPLHMPGAQDITAWVDFGNLRRLGRRMGLYAYPLCSLRVFLLGMGAAAQPLSDARARLRLRHLLVSEIGEAHLVMLQTRGLPAGALRFGRRRLDSACATPPGCATEGAGARNGQRRPPC